MTRRSIRNGIERCDSEIVIVQIFWFEVSGTELREDKPSLVGVAHRSLKYPERNWEFPLQRLPYSVSIEVSGTELRGGLPWMTVVYSAMWSIRNGIEREHNQFLQDEVVRSKYPERNWEREPCIASRPRPSAQVSGTELRDLSMSESSFQPIQVSGTELRGVACAVVECRVQHQVSGTELRVIRFTASSLIPFSCKYPERNWESMMWRDRWRMSSRSIQEGIERGVPDWGSQVFNK